MLTRRIIPCLDIRDGCVVKGVEFKDLVKVGDPLERAARYVNTGADELCFLDVTASGEGRRLSTELVDAISKKLTIPFTVGGGIRTVDDARAILRAGADKVALNTAALHNPSVLTRLASEFGRQCIVISIDTRREANDWILTSYGGTRFSSTTCMDWALEAVDRGAGEILLNVVDTDGTRQGFDLEITAVVAESVSVPVIASGGAGTPQHFVEVFEQTGVSGALAASMFHDNSWTPDELKKILLAEGVEVRT